MFWATKSLAIRFASSIRDTLEMHSTLICVLYVIPGHALSSTNQLYENYPSTL